VGDVTLLLDEARQGNAIAIDRLFELLFPELKRIAHARLRFRDDRMLMDTGSLVNETYLRLLSVQRLAANDRGHFLTYASRVMRSIIVDLVREHRSQRRGGEHRHVTLDTAAINGASPSDADDVLRVHESLEELALIDERLVRVVEMRYFVGFATAEIASSLGVTPRTVERDWEKARSFLYQSLKRD
jgi:RNA polymerase sigma factor (TIGR02999 family)